MKKIIKKVKTIMLITLITILIMPITVKAGYQANKGENSTASTTANDYFEGIRKMESGVLNKEMELDETTYLDKKGNGIDCHMALNTEWGTTAMLAISIYGGNPSSETDTTTSNESGVYSMYGSSGSGTSNIQEYVAGIYEGASNTNMNKIKGADSRYYNLYTSSQELKDIHKGDALTEISWVSGSWVSSSGPVFRRGYSALFGYYDGTGYGSSYNGSRAVVVCGAGL